jgi:hypothetical protein
MHSEWNFCDLKRAVDCVSHDILLSEMEFYGITGIAQKLMRSCLRGRYQRVTMEISAVPNGKKYSMLCLRALY